jgi:hypothetical protein
MSTRIFISYTFRDSSVDSVKLKNAESFFSSYGHVFVDHFAPVSKWHPQLKIISKLLRCHMLVLIESQSVYKSPWVLLELLLAKITLKPIIKLSPTLLENGA